MRFYLRSVGAVISIIGIVLLFLILPKDALFNGVTQNFPAPALMLACFIIIAIGWALIDTFPNEGEGSPFDFGVVPVFNSRRVLFNRESYWPFIIGTLGIGGPLSIPYVWGRVLMPLVATSQPPISLENLYTSSILACFVFVCSFTRNLDYSLSRFAVALGLAIFATVRRSQHGFDTYIPGYLIGFALLFASGVLGVLIARGLRIDKAFRPRPSRGMPG